MTPFCDVCHTEVATVGPFCNHCSRALLDAEAHRLLSLKKAGEDEKEELEAHPPETFTSWQARHENYRRELRRRIGGSNNLHHFSLIGGGCE